MRPLIENLMSEDFFDNQVLNKIRERPREEFIKDIAKRLWDEKLSTEQKNITKIEDLENLLLTEYKKSPHKFDIEFDHFLEVTKAVFMKEQKSLAQVPISVFIDSLGILSLTKRNDNVLMWSHYANNHMGFVIEFDEGHPFFATRNEGDDMLSGLTKVKYYEEIPKIDVLFDRLFGWDPLFFFKSIKWEYEEELRMIRKLSESDRRIANSTGDIYLFALPPECIRSIILGCRMLESEKQKIIGYINKEARYKHVKILEASMDRQSFSIGINPI
jgi:hypothetical protein